MTQDEKYMARCLFLAKAGTYSVAPNPMVGAIVVHDGQIIGEGYHRCCGESHAEPNAIHSVKNKELLTQSTLYVNLEPCSHYGKTPPCAHLIINKGIKRVVIGCLDPNPQVAGKGVEMLLKAGIEVIVGVLEIESRILNRRFITFHEKKRPYIILKWAQTADGFLDHQRTNHHLPALRISNAVTTRFTHKMRAENMAIMTGTNTVLLDNPSLSVRYWTGNNPTRVVIDRQNSIPETFKIKQEKIRTLIFTEKLKSSCSTWIENISIDFQGDGLTNMLCELHKRGIHSVLIEGGSRLLSSFIECDLWDEANVEISNQTIESGVKAPVLMPGYLGYAITVDGHRWHHYYNTFHS